MHEGGFNGLVAVALFTGISACHGEPERPARAESAPSTVRHGDADTDASAAEASTAEAPTAERGTPARVERLLVPGDLAASVVRSKGGEPPVTVFMPGVCSNGSAYLQTFPEAARKHGGVVAIEGDRPCGVAGFRTFSWDAARQHARVEAALAAAGLTAIAPEGVTLVGYSQGAALAEQMVQRWPERYARVVLIGAPTEPSARNLARARAAVMMSCARDVPERMRRAAEAASRANVPATYLEMPGCTHGNVTEGERTFDAAFDWLELHQRPRDPRAIVVPIAGVDPS